MTRMMLGSLAAAMLVAGVSAAPTAAQATADLQITKAADQKTIRVGQTVTYMVTMTNLGPDVATGVVFGDPMPDQLNLVASTCGPISAFCAVETLPSGASATLT